jgi:hypothetical protein
MASFCSLVRSPVRSSLCMFADQFARSMPSFLLDITMLGLTLHKLLPLMRSARSGSNVVQVVVRDGLWAFILVNRSSSSCTLEISLRR